MSLGAARRGHKVVPLAVERGRHAVRARIPAGALGDGTTKLASTHRRGHAGGRSGCDGGVRGTRRSAPARAALPFAWSTAATIEPWAEGVNFFPKIFDDVEAARSTVHILMFGWREGEIGMRMAALLKRKLAENIEVRVIVDGFGSRPYQQAREMFTRPRCRRSADRRQRRLPTRPGRPLPRRSAGRLAAGRDRPGRSPQALRDRRRRSRGPVARVSRTISRTAASMT